MPRGVFRRTIRFGRYALKIPRVARFLEGMRCNRWEREMWRKWRPIFGWENLCPVVAADRLGLAVVMPWAEQPVTREDVDSAHVMDYYPDITAEMKPDDYGRLNGRVLALDYGLPDAHSVQNRRAYYESKKVDASAA